MEIVKDVEVLVQLRPERVIPARILFRFTYHRSRIVKYENGLCGHFDRGEPCIELLKRIIIALSKWKQSIGLRDINHYFISSVPLS